MSCRSCRTLRGYRLARRLVDGDDTRAAETDVVRECNSRAFDLPAVGLAAQLLREFETLRETRCAQRMPLRQQTARRIDDPIAAVGVVVVGDDFRAVAFIAQSESFVSQQFVL